MNLELVVIADQHAAVNTFSPLVQEKRLPLYLSSWLKSGQKDDRLFEANKQVPEGNDWTEGLKVAVFSLKTKTMLIFGDPTYNWRSQLSGRKSAYVGSR